MTPNRVIILVLDGVGVGALPDAADYGDVGSDTLGNLSRFLPLSLPTLQRMGLGTILPLRGVPPVERPLALTGRLAPLSAGKDTTVGHWEHMGLITPIPFPTYPSGFPTEIVDEFSRLIGRSVLGNKAASGTEIIAELGERHLETGNPIVYTSADSVFQIAAHVDIVPVRQLYGWCESARRLLRKPHGVARVIARPFAGEAGHFVRTKDRRDFSLPPPSPTYLDHLQQAGIPVLALGKISEVFAGRGVDQRVKVKSNADNLDLVVDLLRGCSSDARFEAGLLFTNLVEFDMTWGHRNDARGFQEGLSAVDAALPTIIESLQPDDLLLITADHGVDPTTPSTDHSREYVPLLVYPRPANAPDAVYEGGFADTGATTFGYLTGRVPSLAGRDVLVLDPIRGWRPYTPMLSIRGGLTGSIPSRVGPSEAAEAASWLRGRLGQAPDFAVVLGSGLSAALNRDAAEDVEYREVPHWRSGCVVGHPQTLRRAKIGSRDCVLLRGRIHGYEGFDQSELELPVRSLARWGVKRILISTACGAVATGVRPGTILVAREMLDLFCSDEGKVIARLPGTDESLINSLVSCAPTSRRPAVGCHACVPGPQYETPAEVRFLRSLGADVVSMSGAAELRAALDEGLGVCILTAVVNAGDTSHEEVLTVAQQLSVPFTEALRTVILAWS